jgi:hypothetical protein
MRGLVPIGVAASTSAALAVAVLTGGVAHASGSCVSGAPGRRRRRRVGRADVLGSGRFASMRVDPE